MYLEFGRSWAGNQRCVTRLSVGNFPPVQVGIWFLDLELKIFVEQS